MLTYIVAVVFLLASFWVKKHKLPWLVFIAALFFTSNQKIVLMTADFSILRLTVLFIGLRLFLKKEYRTIKLTKADKVLLLWSLVLVLAYSLLRSRVDASVYILGVAYNYLGIYFIFRITIETLDDYINSLKCLALIMIPFVLILSNEMTTGYNLFYKFGAIQEYAEFRNGRFRSAATFGHPIAMGTYAASIAPLFTLFFTKTVRKYTVGAIGIFCCLIIIVGSGSSGPLMTLIVGMTFLAGWHFRAYIKEVFIIWGIGVVMLIIYMKSPIWYLMPRISEAIGGHGWYRAFLIDSAIEHFNEWWLLGTEVTAHWTGTPLARYPDSADITNFFISQGVRGGVFTMMLFVAFLYQLQKIILKNFKEFVLGNKKGAFYIWTIWAVFLSHFITFFSINYYDQSLVFLFFLFAAISSDLLTAQTRKEESASTGKLGVA